MLNLIKQNAILYLQAFMFLHGQTNVLLTKIDIEVLAMVMKHYVCV